MKDLYSFCHTQEEQEKYYDLVKNTYIKIFKRLGLGDITYLTFASGGIFSKYSYEFQTLCDAGEDEIYIHDGKHIAINKEVMTDEALKDLAISRDECRIAKASEVGNIFNLGTRFSDALGLSYTDEAGEKKSTWMGSYGLGPARIMGVIVETLSDDKGIIWPEAIAPFSLHLIVLSKDNHSEVAKLAEELYQKFTDAGVEVLFDDRDDSAGTKFADSDLLGIPMRAVISDKSLASGGVEIKERKSNTSEVIGIDQLLTMYTKNC